MEGVFMGLNSGAVAESVDMVMAIEVFMGLNSGAFAESVEADLVLAILVKSLREGVAGVDLSSKELT